MTRQVFKIKPNERQNAYSTFVVATGCIVVLVLLVSTRLITFNTLVALAFVVAMGCVCIGVFKIYQPLVSYELDETGLIYYHAKGPLKIRWDNVQRIDIPCISKDWDKIELKYIGIKLNDLNSILNESAFRFMSNSITENRAVITQMILAESNNADFSPEQLLNTDKVRLDGHVYNGVQAMYANQIMTLNEYTGFHILLPIASFDREGHKIIKLLKQYRSEYG